MNIEAVIQKHEERLMLLPNVVGVGKGEKAGKVVIKVFVTYKVPESALEPQSVIPKVLDGWRTAVEEIGVVTTQIQSI